MTAYDNKIYIQTGIRKTEENKIRKNPQSQLIVSSQFILNIPTLNLEFTQKTFIALLQRL
jgi:hypothetical protein